MAKEKAKKVSFKGEKSKIFVDENDESEFKVGLFFKEELTRGVGQCPGKSELRIAQIGKEIWDDYLPQRYKYENDQSAQVPDLILSDGARLESYRQEQKKERRVRSFFVMAHDHPKDLEIRMEIRDGKKVIMIKKGNGATPENPVIRRNEIKITAHIDEDIKHVLTELPKEYKSKLGFEFNQKSGLYELMQTNSMRLKTKVRDRVVTQYGTFDFVIEPAFDLGSGRLLAGGPEISRTGYISWPIREFEKEVKGIYIPGHKDDVKAEPEKFGLSREQIGELCTEILIPERLDLIEGAMLYLITNARKDYARYGDIDICDVFTSKSTPGMRQLTPILGGGEKALKTLVQRANQHNKRPFQWD